MNPRRLFLMVHGRPATRRSPRKWNARKPARNHKYRAWIRSLPSAVSGAHDCEAAHTGSDGGMSMKASDYSCIPLTRMEHLQYHALGKKQFEALHGVDCEALAKALNYVWFKFGPEVK